MAKLADFLAILRMIREGVLERFIIPGLGISYWRFIIYMGFAAIVIVALVNKLPIGLLGQSLSEDASRKHREASRKEFLWRQDEMDRRRRFRGGSFAVSRSDRVRYERSERSWGSSKGADVSVD